jgi:hypothetical protein
MCWNNVRVRTELQIYRSRIHRSIFIIFEQILFKPCPRIYRFPTSIVPFQDPRRKRQIRVSLQYQGARGELWPVGGVRLGSPECFIGH